MNLNFMDFKSALKAESKIDKMESLMNQENVSILENKGIRKFLEKKDNLEIFIALIARP